MKQPDKHGFTIVELLLAIAVGTIYAISINTVSTTYMRTGQEVRNLSIANAYVEGKIESLRNAGYNSLATGTTNITSELPTQLLSPRSASLQISAPSSGIKQVDVSVTYNDQGTQRTYSYTTYLGELGVGQ